MVLSLIGLVATIWLGLTGQLALYIHPRYFVFTVIMAVIAGVLALAAFALVPGANDAPDGGHTHAGDAHAHGTSTTATTRTVRDGAGCGRPEAC